MGAGTNTSIALAYVRENSFLPQNGGRANATKIVVVITDGQSFDPDETKKEANLLKAEPGVTVFAIGVGSEISSKELSIISSNSAQTFTVANFDVLQTIQKTLENAACSSGHP
uniref:VWFA domain-containing protein n=1 Tax=Pinctada fucata TaxID=50426 RepID=A0A194AMR8_PINFU